MKINKSINGNITIKNAILHNSLEYLIETQLRDVFLLLVLEVIQNFIPRPSLHRVTFFYQLIPRKRNSPNFSGVLIGTPSQPPSDINIQNIRHSLSTEEL